MTDFILSYPPLVALVRFEQGNDTVCGQDFAYYRGVPPGQYQCYDIGFAWMLVAPGYGEIGGNYGNGALIISKESYPLLPGELVVYFVPVVRKRERHMIGR